MARNANELSVQQGEVLEVRMTLCEEVEEDGEQGRIGLRYSVWEDRRRENTTTAHAEINV